MEARPRTKAKGTFLLTFLCDSAPASLISALLILLSVESTTLEPSHYLAMCVMFSLSPSTVQAYALSGSFDSERQSHSQNFPIAFNGM
jgi:hypothetical protein